MNQPEQPIDPPREPELSPGISLASNALDGLHRAGDLLYYEGQIKAGDLRCWLAVAEVFTVWLQELEKG